MSVLSLSSAEGGTQWNPRALPPSGIRVHNLRRRGVDVLQFQILGPELPGYLWRATLWTALLAVCVCAYYQRIDLGLASSVVLLTTAILLHRRSCAEACEVHVSPDLVTVIGRAEGGAPYTKNIAWSDIESVTARRLRLGSKKALFIKTGAETLVIGKGLPKETLTWLGNMLTLEFAGLTWKPLHSVDRSRTRKRSASAAKPVLLRRDFAFRLIRIYLTEAPDNVRKLGDAVAEKDAAAVRQHAHWLKSASANVGARQLSELCQLMQIHGKENDLSKAGVLYREIAQKNAEAIAWLEGVRDTAGRKVALVMPEAHKPAEEKTETAAVAAEAEREPAGGDEDAPQLDSIVHAKVLVVDDSAVSREVANEYLSEIVDQVVFANDGRSALELWENDSFDLILMDCELAGMDGYECTTQLRRKESLRVGVRTPIVALTANALKGDRDQCIAAGMDDYLSKPYSPEELRQKVLQWVVETAGERGTGEGVETLYAKPEALDFIDVDAEPLAAARRRRAEKRARSDSVARRLAR